LAKINNEIEHEKSAQYKERFSSLNYLFLMCFSEDTVVYPWESQIFGERKIGGHEIDPWESTDIYINDTLGLKKLDKEGKMKAFLFGEDHLHINRVVLIEDIIPGVYKKRE